MIERGGRAWATLGLMSALYFIITAATFGSLGLALPAMVNELGWGWTGAEWASATGPTPAPGSGAAAAVTL